MSETKNTPVVFADVLRRLFSVRNTNGYAELSDGDAVALSKAHCDAHADLLSALEEIAKGEGVFSRDPLTHAKNTIENMKAVAAAALAKVKP